MKTGIFGLITLHTIATFLAPFLLGGILFTIGLVDSAGINYVKVVPQRGGLAGHSRYFLGSSTGSIGFLSHPTDRVSPATRFRTSLEPIRAAKQNEGPDVDSRVSRCGTNLPTKSASVYLNDVELGVIKKVGCYVVLGAHDALPEIYGSGIDYSRYTKIAVKRLFEELDANGCEVLSKAYRAAWPEAEAVALCRGYQGLANMLCRKGDYERLLKIFVDLLDHPLLLRTHMFNQASVAAYRTYVHGWVLPLMLLNVFNLYGHSCFVRVPAFTNFREVTKLEQGPKPKRKELFVDFRCSRSNSVRFEDIGDFHGSVMEACVHAREFKSAVNVYFNNLAFVEALASVTEEGNRCNFTVRDMDPNRFLTERAGESFGNIVDRILEKTEKIGSLFQLKAPSPKVVEQDLSDISSLKASQILQCDRLWANTLMLKHALHNVMLSLDVVTAGGDVHRPKHGSTSSGNHAEVEKLLASYADVSHLGDLPRKYYQQLITKSMFKRVRKDEGHSVKEFMQLLDDMEEDLDTEQPSKKALTIMSFIKKPLKETFMKPEVGTDSPSSKPTLNSTIRQLKDENLKLSDMGVTAVYSVMRRLLSFGITGATAVKLFSLIYPDTRFQAWVHYHLFLCAYEYDMEQRDGNSLDRLLDLMGNWGCIPEPAMYARLFELCSANGMDALILKHARQYMNQREVVSAAREATFGLRPFSRVSFEMYNYLLSVYRRIGRSKEGLLAFKQLLADVNGVYRIIPLPIWRLVRATVEDCGAPPELRAIVDQCEDLSKSADVPSILAAHTRNASMYSRPVIATELESQIDKFVNTG